MKHDMNKTNEICKKVIKILPLITNKIRFHILCILKDNEYTVNQITTLTNGKISNISQQLKILLLADIVSKKRDGKYVYYCIKNHKIEKIIDFLKDTLTQW